MQKNVVVVEADLSIQEVIVLILEEVGYEVTVSRNGNCILEPGWIHPDVYLIDTQGVGDQGLHLCTHLKASEGSLSIPVILMSTVTDLVKLAKAAGADAIIAKPFSLAGLKSMVDRVINRSTTQPI